MKAIINTNSIGIFLNGKLEVVTTDHPNFDRIRDGVKKDDTSYVLGLLNVAETLKEDGIVEKDGHIYLYGEKLHNSLTQRLFDLRREGFKTENLLNFIKNLYENPSKRAVDELYKFLEHFALPITEDGCFLAYKAVRNDYMDIYSGTFRNMVGDKPKMIRCKVDEDKTRHCSSGLHVGAIGYVKQYGNVTQPPVAGKGNRIMIVKVNPKHAVSVPEDSNCQKLRTEQYEVVAEMSDYNSVLEKALYTSTAENSVPTKKVARTPVEEDDTLYFEGRRDGRLDAEAGIEFEEASTDSRKYNRGYKNGYFSK